MKLYKIVFQGIFICLALVWMEICPADVFAAEGSFNQTAAVTVTDTDMWMKYKAPDNGYITISAQASGQASFSSGTVRLYNAKRQALSKNDSFYMTDGMSDVSYGVKKNAVYFIRLKAEGTLSVRFRFQKVKENSGGKKAMAKNLAKKKRVKGVVAAGEKTADWYKIKVKKKQTLHFYYSGKTNGKLAVTFSGTYLKTAKRFILHGTETVQYAYSAERVQPGTYYVKVERAENMSSGYYTLKWQ